LTVQFLPEVQNLIFLKIQMSPTVSIICPIRNEEKYIAECLQALLNQTYKSDQTEILVVDGMSDDRTREIVNEFQAKYANLRLIDNPKKIVPHALNIGIKKASGHYILRMDGHAIAAPDYVEKCLAALDKNGAQGVGGPITTIEDSDTGQAISLAMSSTFGVGNSRFRTSNDKEGFVDSLAFTAYKREVFAKYGQFDEELVRCQDDEFNFRIRKLGGKILLTPEIKSCYYPRSNFKKLWKQYSGYGYWKVRLFQKHFWMMRLRHFIPAAFVGSLIFFLFLTFFVDTAFWLFFASFSFYVVASITAAVLTWLRNKRVTISKILLSFYILHFSYGSGFLWGLIRFAPRWFKRKSLIEVGSAESK